MSNTHETAGRGDATFSQRHGFEELPQPMRLEEISGDLRREVWNAVRQLLRTFERQGPERRYFHADGRRLLERVLGRFAKRAEDEVSTDHRGVMALCKRIVMEGDFNRVLDFLEIAIDEHGRSTEFATAVESLFERHVAAYRLHASGSHCRFFPSSSEAQGRAIERAMETLRDGSMGGATTHLQNAAGHINAGRFADSVRDSIHAVESAARVLSPEDSRTLTPALSALERAGVLKHPALRSAFAKLYGYTSDEQGIRHPLLESGAADVGLEEALFMFGACASFAAYLTEKHRRRTGD